MQSSLPRSDRKYNAEVVQTRIEDYGGKHMKTRLNRILFLLLSSAMLLTAATGCSPKADNWALLSEAYEFVFPLVLMDATKAKITNTVEATNTQAPVNQFIHAAALASADSKDVVTPNVDTVYSQVWLDLKVEPVVLKKPAVERYCSFAVFDAYTNCIAMLGTGGDGGEENTYLITGPDYSGDLPDGMTQVSLPTNMGWIIGRTLCNNPEDLTNVHNIQSEMWVGTLSAFETGSAPESGSFDPDLNGIPLERVLSMTPTEYFARANTLMADNPTAEADAPLMDRLKALNIGPGLTFDPNVLGKEAAEQWKVMLGGLRTKLVEDSEPYLVKNGIWSCYGAPIAEFGTAYSYRSLIALAGLGANPVSAAVYPKAMTDSQGQRLTGEKSYVLRFEADMLPPTQNMGFWSITAYDSSNDLLIDNAIDRYCLNDRSSLIYGEDGSLQIYLQADPPAEECLSNWLPVCDGEFHLHLRLYLPQESVFDGRWTAPEILPNEAP